MDNCDTFHKNIAIALQKISQYLEIDIDVNDSELHEILELLLSNYCKRRELIEEVE